MKLPELLQQLKTLRPYDYKDIEINITYVELVQGTFIIHTTNEEDIAEETEEHVASEMRSKFVESLEELIDKYNTL